MASNVELLTRSHRVLKAKKRQKLRQVNAVVFDEDARREFLTGFHKRKLAKKEESKKRAQAREKEERLEMRREQRRMLAEQAAQNAAKVEEAYGGSLQPAVESDRDDEWGGIVPFPSPDSGAGPSKDERRHEREYEYEYSDEERLATVTVVEDFDPGAHPFGSSATSAVSATRSEQRRAGPTPPSGSVRRGRVTSAAAAAATAEVHSRRWGGEGGEGDGVRARVRGGTNDGPAKKEVRFETKAARRAARATQLARRAEKAGRAGGKAARQNKAGGGKKRRGSRAVR